MPSLPATVQCGPLGIKTLQSAHLAIDATEDVAYSKLDRQYGALYSTKDFQEGRDAKAQGRLPIHHDRQLRLTQSLETDAENVSA